MSTIKYDKHFNLRCFKGILTATVIEHSLSGSGNIRFYGNMDESRNHSVAIIKFKFTLSELQRSLNLNTNRS